MNSSRLVYSTSGPSFCEHCGKSLHKCKCETPPPTLTDEQSILIAREKKGRSGKTVTLIRNIPREKAELEIIAKRLRNLCGSGGTVKKGVIEIQGDHRELIKRTLEEEFAQVKLSGG